MEKACTDTAFRSVGYARSLSAIVLANGIILLLRNRFCVPKNRKENIAQCVLYFTVIDNAVLTVILRSYARFLAAAKLIYGAGL